MKRYDIIQSVDVEELSLCCWSCNIQAQVPSPPPDFSSWWLSPNNTYYNILSNNTWYTSHIYDKIKYIKSWKKTPASSLSSFSRPPSEISSIFTDEKLWISLFCLIYSRFLNNTPHRIRSKISDLLDFQDFDLMVNQLRWVKD